ncbi:hypothetical protein GV828_06125 [Flavobacterium sp. NST-5]|uniref:Bacteriocin n=1 Tax=Flavobacterium ichthyis TaxID=2698827 RepID=A0ABW9Z7C4_9FLAO|nr:hypothetical protein [Flavobacterium ichthyis]
MTKLKSLKDFQKENPELKTNGIQNLVGGTHGLSDNFEIDLKKNTSTSQKKGFLWFWKILATNRMLT